MYAASDGRMYRTTREKCGSASTSGYGVVISLIGIVVEADQVFESISHGQALARSFDRLDMILCTKCNDIVNKV